MMKSFSSNLLIPKKVQNERNEEKYQEKIDFHPSKKEKLLRDDDDEKRQNS